MEIRHCAECSGSGRIVFTGSTNPNDWTSMECTACRGTGHCITDTTCVNAPDIDGPLLLEADTSVSINPTVGLHDPEFCADYTASCDMSPCPDCILAFDDGGSDDDTED